MSVFHRVGHLVKRSWNVYCTSVCVSIGHFPRNPVLMYYLPLDRIEVLDPGATNIVSSRRDHMNQV